MDYPLDIISVGSDTYIVMSKGHHDLNGFIESAREAYPNWLLGGAEHKWCKTVPDRSGEFDSRYVFVEPGTKGAWPATYCYENGDA